MVSQYYAGSGKVCLFVCFVRSKDYIEESEGVAELGSHSEIEGNVEFAAGTFLPPCLLKTWEGFTCVKVWCLLLWLPCRTCLS